MASNSNNKYDDIFKESKYVKKLPIVEIDLDLSPSLRWIPLIDHKDIDHNCVIEFARSYADDIFEYYGYPRITESKSFIILLIKSFVFTLFSIIAYNFTYYDDLIALAKVLNIHPGELFIGNILYEFLAGCTSFICINSDDKLKRLMHVRTLDWPFIKLNKHSTHFIFKKNNKVVYENVGWPGQIGFMTASHKGKFTISLNARYPTYQSTFTSKLLTKLYIYLLSRNNIDEKEREVVTSLVDSTISSLLQKLYSLLSFNAWTASSIIRHVCERNLNYDECIQFLSTAKTIGPCYFIVAGSTRHQGVIIEKGYHHLRMHRIDESNHNFIIQTNDDIELINNELFNENDKSSAPVDFNSTDRYCNTYEYLLEHNASLRMVEAAKLITTSFKKKGVRMNMTLYACIMLPYSYDTSIIGVKSTRCIGGNG